MRRYILISQLFLAQLMCAQNLVPNPSFEDYDSCPKYNGDLFCRPWYSPTRNTPDYFHPCWNGWWPDTMDVPLNLVGNQWPRSGLAYAGFASLYASVNCREYISIKLSDTLTEDVTYCVEFYVSLGDSSWGGTNYVGAHFSNTPDTNYSIFSLVHLPFQPQIECLDVISDTTQWVKIKGTFIATGGECYLTIGTFKPDSVLTYDSIQGDGTSRGSYYYVDDVSVTRCDPPTYSEFSFFPNPSNGSFTLTGDFPVGSTLRF